MSWSYRPALDGVRAVAVYLVVLFHSGLAVAGGGFIGVDVFFVLSGFLITNVLLSDVDDCGRIRFGRFYVVFPVLLLVLVRLGRRRAWLPPAGLAVLLALSLGAQLYWSSADPQHAYYGTDSRAYQLLAGALLAYALRAARWRLTAAGGDTVAVAGLVGVVLLGSGLLDVGISRRGIAATVAAVLLVGGLSAAADGGASRLLSRPAPVHLGRISYATYLWHWPVILLIRQLTNPPPLAVAVSAGAIATGIAAVSYRVLEMPIRRSPVLDRLRWPTVAGGVSVCGLVAVVLVPPVLGSTQRPVVATALPAVHDAAPARGTLPPRHHSAQRARVPSGLDWQRLANDNGPARTCDASAPQRCIVVHGGGPHILLVGDSHARMVAPMLIDLAREHGFTFSMNVMSSCPWQAQLTNLAQSPSDQAKCTTSRDAWYRDVLPKLHPDVVLLASYARDDVAVYGHSLVRTGGSHETLHQLLQHTTTETLARITKTGARALILDSIITSSFDPLDCLARATYVDQCVVATPSHPPVSDGYYAAAAARSRSVFTFDVNPIVCPAAPACEPIIDGINVWRNFNHYSTQILVHDRQRIWQLIVRTGVLAGLR